MPHGLGRSGALPAGCPAYPHGRNSGPGISAGPDGGAEATRAEAEKEYTVAAVSLGSRPRWTRPAELWCRRPTCRGWIIPIAEILEKALNLPVFLEKDVNLLLTYDLQSLALPEGRPDYRHLFRTGIGNAISWNGQLLVGKNGVAGELGHIPQLGSGDICGCGNVGCMEPIGGGRRLSQLCKSVFRNIDVAELWPAMPIPPEVLAQVDAMAATVATEVNILDPDYVIIGGGLPQMKGFPMETFLHRIRVHTRKPMPLEGRKSGLPGQTRQRYYWCGNLRLEEAPAMPETGRRIKGKPEMHIGCHFRVFSGSAQQVVKMRCHWAACSGGTVGRSGRA